MHDPRRSDRWLPIFLALPLALLTAGPALAADPSPGDLLAQKNCLMCHALGGKGGQMGPPLEAVKNWSNVDRIVNYIRDPKSVNPKSIMPASDLDDAALHRLAEYIMGLK